MLNLKLILTLFIALVLNHANASDVVTVNDYMKAAAAAAPAKTANPFADDYRDKMDWAVNLTVPFYTSWFSAQSQPASSPYNCFNNFQCDGSYSATTGLEGTVLVRWTDYFDIGLKAGSIKNDHNSVSTYAGLDAHIRLKTPYGFTVEPGFSALANIKPWSDEFLGLADAPAFFVYDVKVMWRDRFGVVFSAAPGVNSESRGLRLSLETRF